MKYITSLLASAGFVAAHGYVDNATIGGELYQFYQPYMDPYMNPSVRLDLYSFSYRISVDSWISSPIVSRGKS